MPPRLKITIPGTKTSLKSGQVTVSSGNSSLDHIVGGGLPIGSLLLIEEDKHLTYTRALNKYFLAEGALHKHHLFVASLDSDPKQIVKKLPIAIADADDQTRHSNDSNDMRIAFRYNSLPKVNSEQTISNATHSFDLTKQIDANELNTLNITYWNEDDCAAVLDVRRFKNKFFQSLLESLHKQMTMPQYSTTSSEGEKNLLRIGLSSVGSPLWHDEAFEEEFLLFLTVLKSIVRHSLSVCLLTVPVHLIRILDDQLIPRIRNITDYAIELVSFAGSDKETNPIFSEYHGLLNITKMSALNTLAAFCPEPFDLAFKLRRKKFVIETLHLPPELQEAAGGLDDLVPSVGCGSSKKHLLEF